VPVAPPRHRPAHYKDRAQKDRERGSAAARGYDADWERARAAFLAEHPLCMCDDCKEGAVRVTAAIVVDHIIPISVRPDLRLEPSNFRSMSKTCHDRHTAKQVAGGHIGMRGRRG
jgi:5-methylcytosine-specific restriction protein A